MAHSNSTLTVANWKQWHSGIRRPVNDGLMYQFPCRSRFFSTVAANFRYHNIHIDWKKDRLKTVITSYHWLVQFLQTNFVLKKAPATYQWAMDVIISSAKWLSALVYLDHIVSFPKSVINYITQLTQMLTLLQDAGVTLELKVVVLCEEDWLPLSYYTKSNFGTTGSDSRICKQRKGPANWDGTESLLGLLQRISPFWSKLLNSGLTTEGEVAKYQPSPFFFLIAAKKGCSGEPEEATENPPILAIARATDQLTIDTDACNSQIGFVLL